MGEYIETSNRLCWQGWWSPARRDVRTLCTNVDRMSMGDDRDGAMLRSDKNGFGVEDCTGRTHPRTQHGPMRGRLMLSMMSGVFSRLRLCQAADRQDTEHERERKKFSDCVAHARTHFPLKVCWCLTYLRMLHMQQLSHTRRRKQPLSSNQKCCRRIR